VTAPGAARVVVAGAGLLGAAIAYRLTRRGARVTVLERDRPGAGATGGSFAWANATYGKEPRAYFELHRLGLGEWRRLADDLAGAVDVPFGGTLQWARPGAEEPLLAALRRHQGWGSPAYALDGAAMRALVPGLVPGAVGAATFTPDEAAPDAVAVTEALLAVASAGGAELRGGTAVEAIEPDGAGVRVRAGGAAIAADRVVIACGVDTPGLAAQAGVEVPLVESPGALVHTAPQPRLLGPVLLAPEVHVLQRPDGRVVVGRDFSGGDVGLEPAELLAAARVVLPALDGAAIERRTLCRRVLAADGLPVLGRGLDGRAYVAATHSGVSLGPLLGRLVATELLDEVDVDLLAPYRPARFAGAR